MSGDEKNAQIGAAVSEYQAAKVEVAHIEQKIARIFATYLSAGKSMDKQHGSIQEPKLYDGKLVMGWWGHEKLSTDDLLNAEALAGVIAERDKARQRLKAAKDKMENLGITGIQ